MLIATNRKDTLEISEISQQQRGASIHRGSSFEERRLSTSGLIASNKWTNHFARFIYFINAAIILAGLGYITVKQSQGQYRCSTVTVLFDEEIWENAHVAL